MAKKSAKSNKAKAPKAEPETVVPEVEEEETPAPVAAAPSPPTPSVPPTAVVQSSNVMSVVADIVVNYLNGMQQGEKITLKDLAAKVSEKTGLQGSAVIPVISLITKSYEGITIEKGRFGGIYKGGREVTAKKPDERKRCETCHQVIRTKPTGPRKKRAKKEAADGTTGESNTDTVPPTPTGEEATA